MGRTCSTLGKIGIRFWLGSRKERDNHEDLDVRERIILI
jgi:hypothetical protein